MAVSQIEEKILGRLARYTESSDASLSSTLYQTLGLSILLSRKLVKARRLRRLDTSRDTKSLQLYHHIIWMAREALDITERFILPACQDGSQGPECRVMAAKLRASLYHIFCLFHNHPPVSQMSAKSNESRSSPSSIPTPTTNTGQARQSGTKRQNDEVQDRTGKRRPGKPALRDPIPSITSDASYVTNPYGAVPPATPPPNVPPPPIPTEARRTPIHPPGLTPINIPATQAAATFLLPPWNFVPMTREYFDTAQHLANSLLSPSHALRLSISLEHAAFLRDCSKEPDRARRLARRTIKEVYASAEGLDDDEFADASALVQALGGIVRRSSNEMSSRPSQEQLVSSNQRVSRAPPIDRTIAVSPTNRRNNTGSPSQLRSIVRTPERLATVPEVESNDTNGEEEQAISPPVSRLSSRSRQKQTSSSASDKSSKRRAAERAEEQLERSRNSSRSSVSGYVTQKPRGSPSRTGGNG